MQIDGGVLGVKFAALLAGFVGGIVSLSFVKELSRGQAVMSVFTGTVTAGYLTPLVISHLGASSIEVQNVAAFCVGLTAMNIIPGFIKISESFRDNPTKFFNGLGKGDKNDG